MWQDITFTYLLAICKSPWEKCLFCPFFYSVGLGLFLILSYMSCLNIVQSNPLSVISFANIFSHCKGFLFVISFALQNLLSFIGSHWSLFDFHCSRRQIQKDLAMIYVKDCSASAFL